MRVRPRGSSSGRSLSGVRHAAPFRTEVGFKQQRVLLVQLLDATKWKTGMALSEQLRLLVQEVIAVDYREDLKELLALYHPDLVLLLGNGSGISHADVLALREWPRSVWWLDDDGLERPHPAGGDAKLAATQRLEFCSAYEELGAASSEMIVYPVDPDIYQPLPMKEEERADYLLLDDATPARLRWLQAMRRKHPRAKWLAGGKGWPLESVPAAADPQSRARLLNRARAVIRWSWSGTLLYEAAACGTVPFLKTLAAEPVPSNESDSCVRFRTLTGLARRLDAFERLSADEKRAASSRMLKASRFDYSHVPVLLQLLTTAFK